MKNILLTIAAFAAGAGAQSQPAARPEFEVASVKPNNSGGGISWVRLTPGEAVIENASLRECIALAYNVSEDRDDAVSGPDWLTFERYDIVAKFPPSTPQDQVRMMFQNLLVDRYKLKLHREFKELPVYALVAGKNGPKLRESTPGALGGFTMSAGHVTGRAVPITALADRLSSPPFQLGRPVLDRTGLTGVYDFTSDWNLPSSPPSKNNSDSSSRPKNVQWKFWWSIRWKEGPRRTNTDQRFSA